MPTRRCTPLQAAPRDPIIQSGNTLFGTTTGTDILGNKFNNGNLYALDASTRNFTVLHAFAGGSGDGAGGGAVTLAGNVIYGVTPQGGPDNKGTLYSYNLTSGAYSVIHSFGAVGDGATPSAALTPSGGLFYGVTQAGGTSNNGTIFSFNPATNTTNTLYSFSGGITDGISPSGALLQVGGIFYGVTQFGGGKGSGSWFAPGAGTLYSFDPATNTETVLYSFSGHPEGRLPLGAFVKSGDVLYGMTRDGGNVGGYEASGTVYSYDLATGKLSVLHSFGSYDTGDGSHPPGGLVLDGSTLYGIAGSDPDNFGSGILFSISVPEPATLLTLAFGAAILTLRRRVPRASRGG